MSYEHDYYSDQCAGCKWAEWRGGCLNKATADDGSDLDAADRGECKHFEAGQPQRRPPQPGDRVYVHVPLAEYDALRARAEAAEQRAEATEAALAQTRSDRDLMTGLWLATAPMDMLTETLPADRDSRNLLAAVISELDLHPTGAAHTDAGRAVIERIVAEMGGGAA